ncbi:MAG TPA: pyrroline-5-carboxylate reductase dimerization domain-containing protein [Solirubrobacteraceae bacterium]|nr:pyrroline-5-carboxylate reductase dimerization domain-containing protein [Solirubrobacteraceae bacterium]
MIGLIGAGNMARALARGWGEPVLCSDAGSGRAARLVAEVGGEAVASNAELAERAELVILCHKPRQLEAVAEQVDGHARAVVSVLAATPIAAVRAAYPGVPAVRALPNTPVEVRRGVVCLTVPQDVDPAIARDVRERFGRVGRVVEMEDGDVELATALMSTTPAYVALLVEAHVDAAVKHGMPASRAAELFVETLAGTAELLSARGYDTLAVRREVTSPGGITARGVAALEAAGVRAAFADAVGAVLGEQRR